jgi:hypothetical protein
MGVREAGEDRFERSPASAEAATVRGPLGFNRPQGAVVFSRGPAQATPTWILDTRGRRNIRSALIYTPPRTRGRP